MSETLGQRICQRRRMLSLSQEAFGEKMGVSRQAISKWESDAAIPEVDRLIEMSKLFEVSVGWLLGTEETILEEPSAETAIPILFEAPEPAPPAPSARIPQPDSLPEQEPPRSPLLWLSPICAVVAVVSLIFSILAFYRAKPEEVSQPTEPPKSYEELLEHISQLEQDLEFSDRRNESFYERSFEMTADMSEISTLLESLKAYVYAMPNASGPLDGLTEYPQFQTWNLSGNLDSSLSNVKLLFSCVPSAPDKIAHIELVIMQGDSEYDSFICWQSSDVLTHYVEFDLPQENGFRYEVEISYSNNTTERFELTGHHMSDLLDGTQPQCQATRLDESKNTASTGVSASYKNITLSAPALMPDHYQWDWSGLRLVHYHNGVEKARHDLTDMVATLYHTGDSLSFSVGNKTFAFTGSKDGDIHEIRLEGDLDMNYTTELLDGVHYDFSILLQKWERTDGTAHLVENT